MPAPIVIMAGGPATGKTTLGRRIAATLKIPYFSKDQVKEAMFHHVGCPVTWSAQGPLAGDKMDAASLAILLCLMEEHSRAAKACVIDSTFQEKEFSRLAAMQERFPFIPIQVHCHTEPAELARRYRQRVESCDRHPGHLDHQLAAEFNAQALKQHYRPLDLGGPVFRIDTTRRQEASVQDLLKSLREFF